MTKALTQRTLIAGRLTWEALALAVPVEQIPLTYSVCLWEEEWAEVWVDKEEAGGAMEEVSQVAWEDSLEASTWEAVDKAKTLLSDLADSKL